LLAVGLHTCTAVARSLCVSWAFLLFFVMLCARWNWQLACQFFTANLLSYRIVSEMKRQLKQC